MGTMVQSPDEFDPLLEISSLQPKTFGHNGIGDMQKSALQALKVLAGRSSIDFEQANAVLKNSSERQNSSSHGGYKDIVAPPRERRPDLGLNRKRPRFSIKPAASKPSVGGGTSLNNLEEFPDPADFFKAMADDERAEKEERRLSGEVSTELTQTKLSKVRRERRPGLPGRERKSNNQQRFASMFSPIDEKLEPSQETLSGSVISAIDENLEPSQELLSTLGSPNPSRVRSTSTHNNGASQERELADPTAEEKNKMASLLDKLLSQDLDLDGDGAVKFLQKNFKPGPITLDGQHLPEVKSLRKSEDKVSLERAAKALSDKMNVPKRITGKRSVEKKQVPASSTYSPDSPTPPRSSFLSVPLPLNYVLDADLRRNPFTFSGIDEILPVKDSIHVENSDKDGGMVHVDSTFDKADVYETEPSSLDKFVSKAKEKLPSASGMVSNKMMTEDATQVVDYMEDSSNKSSEHNSGSVDKANDVQQLEAVDKHSNMDLDTLVTDLAKTFDPLDDTTTEYSENTNPAHTDMDLDTYIPDDLSYLIDTMENNLPGLQNQVDHSSNKPDIGLEDKVEDPQIVSSEGVNLGDKGSTEENQRSSASELVISCPIDKDHPEDGISEKAATLSEVHNKVPEERSKEPSSLLRKQKAAPKGSDCTKEVSKRKSVAGDSVNVRKTQKPTQYLREQEISRRKSLTGAGTLWQQGVRRSTRMKMKPLEYWRGERLLYARVHESLVTVVGCKCISPAKNNESPKLKVRSFVSDEYKDIVDKVADMQGKRVVSLKGR